MNQLSNNRTIINVIGIPAITYILWQGGFLFALFVLVVMMIGINEFYRLTTTKDQSLTFTEIHPEGPLANSSFSIAVRNNNLWIVYGGYDDAYTPLQQKKGFSHFNGENWVNTRFDSNFPVIDLNFITIDPNNENKAYISSFGDTRDINSIFDMETELFPCLVEMKFLGVKVDVQKAHTMKQELASQEATLIQAVKKDTGIDTQIWAARSIAQVFDKLKLDYDKTEKTSAPSFTKNFLQEHKHPVVNKIAKAREINKAHTTFIDTILRYEHKGRIHADINQIRSDQGGTVTGRFSYSNPNLQQIPARNKDLGPRIRALFVPEEGHTWGCFDYSQQEPRLVVHYAALQNLYGVDDVLEAYREGDADFHTIVADMAEIPRSQAKTINLGLFYGMGKNKLQAELGINKESAEDLFKKYT